MDKKKIIIELNKKGINCKSGSCPEIYKEKAFKKLGTKYFTQNAKKLGEESIAFEVHPNLTNNEIKFICNSIIEIADICSANIKPLDMTNHKNEDYKPLVSIIMSCFNGEKYLSRALESIIDQEYHNWELIFGIINRMTIAQ